MLFYFMLNYGLNKIIRGLNTKYLFFISINILVLINLIIKSSSEEDCHISVPDSITSQKLNNIICIGGSYSTYINFANFSNASLIIESSKDTSDTNRAFYGITADGKPYFKNNNYFLNIDAKSGKREESENFIITVNDDKYSEYLMCIAKDTNIELYDLTKGAMLDIQSTTTFINNKNMDSFVQSGINYYDGKN